MQPRKHALTAPDLILCLLLVAAGALAAYVALRPPSDTGERAPLTYTLRITGADATLLADGIPIAVGDAVSSENGTLPLGTVVAVSSRPHRRAVLSKDRVTTAEVPARVDLDITVRADGILRPTRGWRVSEVRIAAGATGGYRIGGCYVSQATVIGMTVGAGSDGSGNADGEEGSDGGAE